MSTVLLNLSGGLDSTLALHQALVAGRRVLVHHVELTTHEGRVAHERAAVQAVLDWMLASGLDRWDLVTTRFAYGTAGHIVRDIEVVRTITGWVLRHPDRRHIDTVIASGIADDPRLDDAEVARIRTLLEAAAGRPIVLERPLRHLTKADVLAALPPDLAGRCWWCRTPRRGRECGTCRTCRQVARAREVAA